MKIFIPIIILGLFVFMMAFISCDSGSPEPDTINPVEVAESKLNEIPGVDKEVSVVKETTKTIIGGVANIPLPEGSDPAILGGGG